MQVFKLKRLNFEYFYQKEDSKHINRDFTQLDFHAIVNTLFASLIRNYKTHERLHILLTGKWPAFV